MYKSGEIHEVMKEFEKSLGNMPVYVGASLDREQMSEIENEDGRISKRYKNNQYYSNGRVNEFFLLYLHGYALGKLEGRMQE